MQKYQHIIRVMSPVLKSSTLENMLCSGKEALLTRSQHDHAFNLLTEAGMEASNISMTQFEIYEFKKSDLPVIVTLYRSWIFDREEYSIQIREAS